MHLGSSDLSVSLCGSAFTAAQVSDHQTSRAATVFAPCPQTHRHRGGGSGDVEEGWDRKHSLSVVTSGYSDSRGYRGSKAIETTFM